eukprot:2096883-Prymnesium_polylepis.1
MRLKQIAAKKVVENRAGHAKHDVRRHHEGDAMESVMMMRATSVRSTAFDRPIATRESAREARSSGRWPMLSPEAVSGATRAL